MLNFQRRSPGSGERAPLTGDGSPQGRTTRSFELCSGMSTRVVANADKPRKVPVKVDPKVFFANERTFLAWLHMALLVGGTGVAILAFSGARGPEAIYGFVLLPVAVAFICYALRQYYVRAHAIRSREPGPYEDKNGPYDLFFCHLSRPCCLGTLSGSSSFSPPPPTSSYISPKPRHKSAPLSLALSFLSLAATCASSSLTFFLYPEDHAQQTGVVAPQSLDDAY